MNDETPKISPVIAGKLATFIVKALRTESANILPQVCEGFGLRTGKIEEAFRSKGNYINARIRHLSTKDIYILAKKLEGKYQNSELDQFLSENYFDDHLNLISKFNDIKQTIIEQIQKSRYVIWIAVSWFTDEDFANELYKRSKEGINVQIIMNDDDINSKLSDKLKNYFEVLMYTNKEPYLNLMHNKFCMIDFKYVIHGSYNWTIKAQYNAETVSLIENQMNAFAFADQFIQIKRLIMKDCT